MNSEYALVKLLLQEPHHIVELYRKGIKRKLFKNPNYGKAYKMIHDVHTHFNSVPSTEKLEELGIKNDGAPVNQTIEYCVAQIVTDYQKRAMKDVLLASGNALTTEGPDAAMEILKAAQEYLPQLEKAERSKNIVEDNEDFLERYNTRAKFKGQILGIPTGFALLDSTTMGLMPQWLVTISGRNAQFKTWVLLQWVATAWKTGHNIALFSCEMSVPELEVRIHGLMAGVAPTKVQHGLMNELEYAQVEAHLENTKSPQFGKLILNDNPQTIAEVDYEVSEMNKTEFPIDIIFIDSVYRMSAEGESDSTRQKNIARKAKDLAKKHNVPVVVTVQLNREFAKANTGDKKTSGGSSEFIYGTDAWGQDADLIMSINRPESYEAYHYSDFNTTKFRHGPELDYMLEINLAVPRVVMVDADAAKARITGEPNKVTQKADLRLDQAKKALDADDKAKLDKLSWTMDLSLDTGDDVKEDEDGIEEQ